MQMLFCLSYSADKPSFSGVGTYKNAVQPAEDAAWRLELECCYYFSAFVFFARFSLATASMSLIRFSWFTRVALGS